MSESEAKGKKPQPELVEGMQNCMGIADLPLDKFVEKILKLDRERLIELLGYFKGYYDHAERRVDSGGVM